MRAATGRSWDEWFALLDEWGARDRPHKEIAAWLRSRGDISGWWSQSVTVTYEQARGIRAPGQMADGFAITASKTIAAPLEIVMHAVNDPDERERWLPGAEMHRRKTTAARSARYDWEDGATRVRRVVRAQGRGPQRRLALAREAARRGRGRRDEGVLARSAAGAQGAPRGMSEVRVDPALDPLEALAAIELDGKPGFTDLDAADLARFEPIAELEMPAEPYRLVRLRPRRRVPQRHAGGGAARDPRRPVAHR